MYIVMYLVSCLCDCYLAFLANRELTMSRCPLAAAQTSGGAWKSFPMYKQEMRKNRTLPFEAKKEKRQNCRQEIILPDEVLERWDPPQLQEAG